MWTKIKLSRIAKFPFIDGWVFCIVVQVLTLVDQSTLKMHLNAWVNSKRQCGLTDLSQRNVFTAPVLCVVFYLNGHQVAYTLMSFLASVVYDSKVWPENGFSVVSLWGHQRRSLGGNPITENLILKKNKLVLKSLTVRCVTSIDYKYDLKWLNTPSNNF